MRPLVLWTTTCEYVQNILSSALHSIHRTGIGSTSSMRPLPAQVMRTLSATCGNNEVFAAAEGGRELPQHTLHKLRLARSPSD